MQGTIIEAGPRFNVGDRVSEPGMTMQGTVIGKLANRYVVKWDDGSGRIYAGVMLVGA